jgi:ascorbate-specific PTS system EIIC-type component UlaA
MSTGRILTYLVAAILILIGLGLAVIIGLSYIVQAGNGGSIIVGSIFLIVGLILIAGGAYLIYRAGVVKAAPVTQNVTVKVDLPANVNMDTLKCKSCGGTLTMDNIQMVAGAPVVHCPYCGTTYQLTEEPKW